MPHPDTLTNPPEALTPPANTQRLGAALAQLGQFAGLAPRISVNEEIVADKELRKDLDVQLQKVKSLPPSRERSLVITKIQEAVMWLGMDLKRINDLQPQEAKAPNPYPNSYNPANTVIEPTADGLKL